MCLHCTWVNENGNSHCTCVGSTAYRINVTNNFFARSYWCDHAKTIGKLLVRIGKVCGIDATQAGRAIASMIKEATSELFDTFRSDLPLCSEVNNGALIVLISEDVVEAYGPCWIPIRFVQKKKSSYICAFCDMVQRNSCTHVRKYHQARMHSGIEESPKEVSGEGDFSRAYPLPTSSFDTNAMHSISKLPVAPVNCSRALRIDNFICELSKKGSSFLVTAPQICAVCQSSRNELLRSMVKGGVIMCTLEPCGMGVETFSCNNAKCDVEIKAEGREHCIVLQSLTTAGTHIMLREIVKSVALSNGTMGGRVEQAHAIGTTVIEAHFNLSQFAGSAVSRSSRIVEELCRIMTRLMALAPPKSLFTCPTCTSKDGKKHLHALCVDSVWKGCNKKSRKKFGQVSEECKPKAVSKATTSRNPMRPLDSSSIANKLSLSCWRP